ncbi:hypothetical protein ACVW0K_007212 [Streptomyces filamentosus]
MTASPDLHRLPDLMTTVADLLDHLGDAPGLRVGFHPTLTPGVRLLDQTGCPYGDAVGPLDRIGAALGQQLVHASHHDILQEVTVSGSWLGTQVYASHLYTDGPSSAYPAKPCTRPAGDLARRVRDFIGWAGQDWARDAESLHVYDENGSPCVHVALRTEAALDDALAALLDSAGPLQYHHPRAHPDIATGSVLLDDGTVITASVFHPGTPSTTRG